MQKKEENSTITVPVPDQNEIRLEPYNVSFDDLK